MNSLLKFTKDALNHINNFDDWFDNHIEDVKDITDTASDMIAPVKSFISIVKIVKSRKLKNFLKAYAKEIHSKHGKIDEKYSSQLKTYLENPINLNMVFESIETSINANSIYSASCIGYMAGKQMANMYQTNNKFFMLIHAFKNLNNFELYSAIKILKSVKDYSKPQNINHLNVISIGTPSEYTIQKLKNLQVVDTNQTMKVTYIGAIDSGSFFMSDITEEFMDIIVNSGNYNLMVKDFSYQE